GSDAGAIGSPPPFGDFGGQGPLNGGIEINQSIGPAEKDAVSLRGGAVCLCARCEYRPGARMMFVEQAQEAEFVRLAWCFEICEYDVNSDRIEDASRLIFTGGLDDLQPGLAQMAGCQGTFERLVLHDEDKIARRSGRTFHRNRLLQHGDP